MSRKKHSYQQTLRVLRVLIEYDQSHGFAIAKITGLQEGTVYPILKRLHREGYLEASWHLDNHRGPPRKMYSLTLEGIELYRSRLKDTRQTEDTQEFYSFGEAK